LSLASEPPRSRLRGTDQLIRMPIGSGPQPFTGFPAIVGMLPAICRNRCPRSVGLRKTIRHLGLPHEF
jgi:hypothetical protein